MQAPRDSDFVGNRPNLDVLQLRLIGKLLVHATSLVPATTWPRARARVRAREKEKGPSSLLPPPGS